jgi:hypothetical protein
MNLSVDVMMGSILQSFLAGNPEEYSDKQYETVS